MASVAPVAWTSSVRWAATLVDVADGAVAAVELLEQTALDGWLQQQHVRVQGLSSASRFTAKPGEALHIIDDQGAVERVTLGIESPTHIWSYAMLPGRLQPGLTYSLPGLTDLATANAATLGWILGTYTFQRYKTKGAAAKDTPPRLLWPSACDRQVVEALARALFWVRDLITTPAEDMGPPHLAAEVEALTAAHPGAVLRQVVGRELLEANYPAVHTVGRASSREPRLLDLRWQPEGTGAAGELPLVVLVGKGVCFDTGGLNVKGGASMRLMKKDMGGAALVLGLAHLVMAARLPVRLRVLVPAVENSISGDSFRPLDVLQTRSGLTVENNNCDAEGRLVLADALWEGAGEGPDLLLDVATLTGAARAALGPEIPAMFCSCQETATQLLQHAEAQGDALWQLPLHRAYRKLLDSKVADIASTGGEGTPGAIVAALFLQEFTRASPRWVHLDTGAWTVASQARPGRPEGGEALGLRALWGLLQTRYGGAGP